MLRRGKCTEEDDGVLRKTQQYRRMGYLGGTLIHHGDSSLISSLPIQDLTSHVTYRGGNSHCYVTCILHMGLLVGLCVCVCMSV